MDGQGKAVAGDHSAGYIMQVNERTAVLARECAHDPPRRLLRFDEHARAARFVLEPEFETSG
jgi:hypothetical protein